MKFKIKYLFQTSGRYGKYNYGGTETVEAATKDEAVEKLQADIASGTRYKRYKFRVIEIIEV